MTRSRNREAMALPEDSASIGDRAAFGLDQSETRVSRCGTHGQQALQPTTAPAQQPKRRSHVSYREVEPGAYTIGQVCSRVSIGRSTFYRLRDAGELPFLEEVRPRIGKRARYRADLVEQYVAGRFNRNPFEIVRGKRA